MERRESDENPCDEAYEELLASALGLVMDGREAELEAWLAERGELRERLEAGLEELAAVGLIQRDSTRERRLGDYRVLETLGRGGMGHVYLALDERLGRKVALKVLRDLGEGGAGADERKLRFHREAQVVASLHHPNLVTLLSSGEDGGVPWLAFEYVEGLTWEDAVAALGRAEGRPTGAGLAALLLPEDEPTPARFEGQYTDACLELGLDVARALEAAHRRGVLHRDVKLSNVLLDRRGAGRLFDFGLASMEDDLGLTRTSTYLGSRRTMPPEQWTRPAYELDVRADVYSLGVTLFHALSLRPAFDQGDEGALRQAVEAGRAPRLAELGLSRDLDAVVGRAMEPDRDLRYPDVTSFADDLERILVGLPPRARRVGTTRRLWSWARRKPIHATAWTLAFLLLTIVPTLFGLQERENRRELDDLLAEQTQLRIQADEAAALSNEAFFALSSSIARWTPVDGMIRERINGALGQAADLLDRAERVEPEMRAGMLVSLGKAAFAFGYFDDAEARLLAALELIEETPGPQHELVGEAARHLSWIHHLEGRRELALPYYEQATGALEAGLPESDVELLLAVRTSHADCLAELGRREEGLQVTLADRDLHNDPRLGWTPSERVEYVRGLGRRCVELGDYELALEFLDEADAIIDADIGGDELLAALVAGLRARAQLHTDPLSVTEEELAALRRTLELRLGTRHFETLQAVSLHARLLWNKGEGHAASQYIADYRVELALPERSLPVQLLLLECYGSYHLRSFDRLEHQVALLKPRIESDDFTGLEKIVDEYQIFRAIVLDQEADPDPYRVSRIEEHLSGIQATYAPVQHLELLAQRYLGRFAARRGDVVEARQHYERALTIAAAEPAWLSYYVPDVEADLAALTGAGVEPVGDGEFTD